MSERIKLQVIEVSEPKEVGTKGAKKLVFKGKSPDGKELPYFTFKTTLFDAIKVGKEIDAEVEVKIREVEGNTYTDRQISQLFFNGQPVGGQARQWQARGDNPEQRQSIEAQTAIKAITELRVADKLTDLSLEYQALLKWCRDRIGVQGKVSPLPKSLPSELQSKSSVVKEETNAVAPEEAVEPVYPIDKVDSAWLKETRDIIHFTDSTTKSWLRSQFRLYPKLEQKAFLALPLKEVLNSLNADQVEKFATHIRLMRESSGT